MTTTTFDPLRYKQATTEQWQAAADAWNRWSPTIEDWLGSATVVMLDLAGIRQGGCVLDVAAGAGGQTLAAAARVGNSGQVLATDVAPAILAFAEDNALREGLTNVAVRVMDGENLEVEPGHFDAVISRVGLIYFPDQHRALLGMLRALRPGGRAAAIVYSTPERNGFFSVPVSVIRDRAELPPPAPGQPGPFSLGGPGIADAAFRDAGFIDVVAVRIDAPLRLATAADCVQFERDSFGALHQMLASLDEEARNDAWADITERLTAYETPDGFVGPCELVVVAGTAPGASS
jgi:SAM-dependent methyltransferase